MEAKSPYACRGLKITAVEPDSIAAELSLCEGTRLLAVDGRLVEDVFSFRLAENTEKLTLLLWNEEEDLFEVEIEKDEDDLLGLSLEVVPAGSYEHCHNKCLFCFVDQLPEGMRRTLYFKDDDMRLSFLHGNYITLTNISDDELDRLIGLRFSPVNVSVHTTDPELRVHMMNNPRAAKIMTQLRRIVSAGLDVNIQIVLCPGINDGSALERTLSDLVDLGEFVRSIALVPVGMTQFRKQNHLYPLQPVDEEIAAQVLDQIERWQINLLAARGTRLIYAADEFYLKAGRAFPPFEAYEDFLQIENGVGMVVNFWRELSDLLSADELPELNVETDSAGEEFQLSGPPVVAVATGLLAAPVLAEAVAGLSERFKLTVRVEGIRNDFFGSSISVAGLLTGQDIMRQLEQRMGRERFSFLLLPACMLKRDEQLFLDDLTLEKLAEALSVRVIVVPETAEGLIAGLQMIRAARDGCIRS
jgi:putative radical SAM enzyme (TIGR03279 family)